MQMEPEGWSSDEKYSHLLPAQKIWLDGSFAEERKNSEWSREIGKQFGRWIIYRYAGMEGPDKVFLGDQEMNRFSEIMEDSLRKEANMTL